MIGGLVAAAGLLVANAFFVAVEFALIAARRSRIEQRAGEGSLRARAAQRSMHELSFLLSAVQLGITMASLGLGYVAEPAVARLLEGPLQAASVPEGTSHTVALILALTIVVFLHMVVGEMVPKNIAIAEPEASALLLAPPLRAFAFVFRPVIALLNGAANRLLRLLGVEPRDELAELHTAQEIAEMLAASRREGLLEEEEHRLMTGALGFGDRKVESIMVPRQRIVAVRATAAVNEVAQRAVDSGHSRLPVYGRDLDEVLGYVHAKDLLRLGPEDGPRPVPQSLVRRMLVVTGSGGLQHLLLALRRSRLHFALVVDGSGRTVGIVTLDDVIEALVGDIRHEQDRASHRQAGGGP